MPPVELPAASIWEAVATAGLPALLMAMAVWWLQKSNRELVGALNTERSERLDAMEKHIGECDFDRKELRNMLLRHLGAAHETLSIQTERPRQ